MLLFKDILKALLKALIKALYYVCNIFALKTKNLSLTVVTAGTGDNSYLRCHPA